MKFADFVNNRYETVTYEKSTLPNDRIFLGIDGELGACFTLLTWTRNFMKYAFIPKVAFHYLFTLIGLAKDPEPVMMNRVKESKQKELEAKAKKVGMLQMVQNPTSETTTPA